ncbi:hypothetical protein [uncultured Tenacibaculum sp.]|nr:hypothetical protein [uncultured Tenacibaculum sp.]
MKYINRIFVIIFTLLLLLGIVDINNLIFATLFAIPLGFCQVLVCIAILFKWKILSRRSKVFEVIYFSLVTFYFVTWHFFMSYPTASISKELFFNIMPIILAFSVTLFLENLKLE